MYYICVCTHTYIKHKTLCNLVSAVRTMHHKVYYSRNKSVPCILILSKIVKCFN